MRIRTIDVGDEADYKAWFAAHDAGHRDVFPGGPHWLEHELRVQLESNTIRDVTLWAADDEGDVVGAAILDLPQKDNLRLAEVDVAVRPDARRRGVGSALLAAAEQEARARGRTSSLTEIDGMLPETEHAGTAFAERHGYTRRIDEIARVQRPRFDLDAMAAMEREALPHADGYEIVAWRQRVPDEHVTEFARLLGRMSTDAPLGDMDYDEENWDAERVRTREQRLERMHRDSWCAVAVAPDGTMAGQTEIVAPSGDDAFAFQDQTIVDPRHRGHRLGLLLKIANLRNVLDTRPGIQAIWTWNAASNTFMISVNEKLGYVPEGWGAAFQRDL